MRALADDILVMQGGKMVEQGPAEQVFSHPAQAYTRALIAAALNLEAVETGAVAT